MSNNNESLVAVRSTKWDEKHEAKLRDALRKHPIILDWLVDAQADAVDSQISHPVDFDESPLKTATINAYSKGRISILMELVGQAQILLKQPASDEE